MVTSPAIKGPVQSDETRDEDRAASVAVCRRGRSEHLSKGLSRSAEPVDIGTECVHYSSCLETQIGCPQGAGGPSGCHMHGLSATLMLVSVRGSRTEQGLVWRA